MRTYCIRYQLTDGYYTCEFVHDAAGTATLDDVRQVAEAEAKECDRVECVDDVYLMEAV